VVLEISAREREEALGIEKVGVVEMRKL